jgi:hypothetical protein
MRLADTREGGEQLRRHIMEKGADAEAGRICRRDLGNEAS